MGGIDMSKWMELALKYACVCDVNSVNSVISSKIIPIHANNIAHGRRNQGLIDANGYSCSNVVQFRKPNTKIVGK
jgi:hypothetical protein